MATGVEERAGIRERFLAQLSQPRPPRKRAPGIVEPSFSAVGLVVGLYFFAISLTPSLLPRAGYVQGINSGVAFMVGYGIGTSAYAIYRFLGVPRATGRVRMALILVALALIGVQAGVAIWAYVGWQNQVRLNFGMDPLSPTVWPVIVVTAALVAAPLLVIARSLRALFRWADDLLDRWLPRRLAVLTAAVLLIAALWWVASGAFTNAFFTASNWVFSGRDLADKPGVTQPASATRSGSPDSLIGFDSLGRQGRAFVSSVPSAVDIDAFTGGGAMEPIRAYVGLRSADTLQERAELLLAELVRTGAFERELLVVTTTTGTGFIDPHGVDPLEYLWNGDTAIAGAQYSYLPSWISMLADQDVVQDTSRVVFRTIHDHWSTLPANDRPDLYLYGLSLGSYGVEAVLSSADILNEPIDGALMSGPTFVNGMHDEITAARDAGSPSWLPEFSDGRTVRFMNEQGGLERGAAAWGPTRLVYLQHGTDPVVFFSGDLAFDEPEWLQGERAPGVVDDMEWYPIVTLWQVLLDLPAAGSIPEGYGHLYTHRSNLAAWVGITDPEDWTEADTESLAALLDELQAQREAALGSNPSETG
ncbi:alpha/beta hydrolase [Demequina activiva]|uniref:Membrane protein n=1 Tax=Demequina activiva TaxID=1582364 RepID=A0A919PZT8_9MICO|nr:alpha/beta-hydrolase family protein [Demequina activiva]GIG53371.1 membrane protein [Demequina activiva]